MPTRLGITFPGHDGAKPITFVCDSGDYDRADELGPAVAQVVRLLVMNDWGSPGADVTLEDV